MRHGEVDYHFGGKGVADPDAVELTEKGCRQAALMGDSLADITFDLSAHTGLLRTKQTLNAALGGRGVPIEEISSLREIKTGHFADFTPERIEAEFVYGFETAHHPGACFAGGEEFAAFYDRIAGAMAALLARNDWTTALLVCHGGTNRAVLSWVTHGGPEGMASFEQDTVRRFIRTLNFTPYDPVKTGKYLTNMELYKLGRSG
jgi:probable phosphoglycerate mutase